MSGLGCAEEAKTRAGAQLQATRDAEAQTGLRVAKKTGGPTATTLLLQQVSYV